ncbi:hypothetical protein [Nonomuraea sp. NPDC049784]|uniref:hypothetical protein n=1 Tax=Nonomuraea sp. NPDC049784 TaxID=3154361 RepID=UPI0033D0F200
MRLAPDQIPTSVTETAEYCHQAGGTPADVLEAIAWAVAVLEGYDADRHDVHRANVSDHAEWEYYVLSVEREREDGTSPYSEDDDTLDKLTGEDRPVFYRRVAEWSETYVSPGEKR